MTDVLILRIDAPLVSFGRVVVDSLGVTAPLPGRAMLCGLIGNALGLKHADADSLTRLQHRLRYAVRCDRVGSQITDYQTVDLSQDFMREGWTTHGVAEGRDGGPAKTGTHIRYRDYLADALYTIALRVTPADESPTLADIEHALVMPKRPLYIGRKACLPSAPILLRRSSAATLLAALEAEPTPARSSSSALTAWWPADEDTDRPGARLIPVTDDRDWTNQIHVGRRWIHEGTIHA